MYDATAKTITLTIAGAVSGDVISTTNLEDHEGNGFVNQKFTFDGAQWVQSAK
ncbi:hypothetical protein D3C74_424970 [compost metagenome]